MHKANKTLSTSIRACGHKKALKSILLFKYLQQRINSATMTPLFLLSSSKNGMRRCVTRVPVSSLAQSTADNNASAMAYSLSQACPLDQPQQQRWLSDAATWIPEMSPTMQEQIINSQNQLKMSSRNNTEKDWFQQDKAARRQAYVKKLRERELLEERYTQAYADLMLFDNEKTRGSL